MNRYFLCFFLLGILLDLVILFQQKRYAQGNRHLSDATNTALVAAGNGRIYLLDVGSMKPLWSFSSGPQIYSSYQAFNDEKNSFEIENNDYYIDCDEDWELSVHNSHDKSNKLKLMKSLEEYISSTPQITENGGFIVGSKETSVFLVDAKTGKTISNENTNKLLLYISRTDYKLNSFRPNSNKDLWNMTVAEIGAAYCKMPLSCHARVPVYRLRNNQVLESLSLPYVRKSLISFNTLLALILGYVFFEVKSSEKETCSSDANGAGKCRSMWHLVKTFGKSLISFYTLLCLFLGYVFSKVISSKKALHSENETSSSDVNGAGKSIIDKETSSYDANGDGESISKNETSSSNANVTKKCRRGKKKTSSKKDVRRIGKLVVSRKVIANGVNGTIVFKGTYEDRSVAVKRLVIDKGVTIVFEGTYGDHSVVVKRLVMNHKDISEGVNGTIVFEGNYEDRSVSVKRLVMDHKEIAKGVNGTIVFEGTYGDRSVAVKRLVMDHKEISKGVNGTIVFEGTYGDRSVALKRLVMDYKEIANGFNAIAYKEIKSLVKSDDHPNIVRYYGLKKDTDFMYLALELCSCSLYDLILVNSKPSIKPIVRNPNVGDPLGAEVEEERKRCLESMKGRNLECQLWNLDGHPSPLLIKLMRDIVSGLIKLHNTGIVHVNLKPSNVLIIIRKGSDICAKLSDMGVNRHLESDVVSVSYHTSGWQAPELLKHERHTLAVDLFSLGCVLFFCMTGGRHPFRTRVERDANILDNQFDLFSVEDIPGAVDLLEQLLDPVAKKRPKALDVLRHPLFWNAEKRLSFLSDVSDRVEKDRVTQTQSILVSSLENIVLDENWNTNMDSLLVSNIEKFRRYNYSSVCDLLRVIRNTKSHFYELPEEIQVILGPKPEGFNRYFERLFPKLLIGVYDVIKQSIKEDCFVKYFRREDI